ncbi:hypothetical protein L210DRAFT_3481759 [Boletus edulis BED1]|uniref:Uncharacterized protein n=1 Tax=Boletus edulis BED1 TaxID=1328754 RepID=A0AAD4GDY4_BOLED|nr:hypothetical protein L210DRAFT_3481759 [Boletus edulis BED1]
MPGPCNNRGKKRQRARRDKKPPQHQHPIQALPGPSPQLHDFDDATHDPHESPFDPPHPCDDGVFIATPSIYDPGNGPRVRDTRAFLSSFFAQPPALDDELCAEFAQEEVLQMLCTVLPEDYAIILWYNKSRTTGRVCPSCRRLYSLGDVLPELIQDTPKIFPEIRHPYLAREQEISGLCSPLCFIMASFNHPGAIKTTWGRMAQEIDDRTWELLNSPGSSTCDQGLSLLVKMARLPDLGLGQLCLPDIDFESDG